MTLRTVRWLPPLVLLALVTLFLWQLLFTNLILGRGDTFFYFYPYWAYRNAMLAAGQLPLWNPYLFLGAPFLANIQAGVLYPPNWPLAFFTAPVAVKLSLAAHVYLAAIGAFSFARRVLSLDALAATIAGAAFALGGALLAKAEQINQLQGLAWLPWLLLLTHLLHLRPNRRTLALLALVLALQLLAGHTQTTFISLGAMGLWVLTTWQPGRSRAAWQPLARTVGWLAAAGVLAGLLAAAQLWPTLELSGLSFRSGGLQPNDVVSFSLHPLVAGRALLPGYRRGLFTEYVAYVGVAGLLLATAGAWATRQTRTTRQLVVLAAVGLLLALGGFTPLYWGLAYLPGFDLFRVPARWLAVWGFAIAMLAGVGIQALPKDRRSLRIGASVVAVLLLLAGTSGGITPAGEQGPLGAPAFLDWLAWLAAAVAVLTLLASGQGFGNRQRWLLAGLVCLELFVASWRLPLNTLTTPQAWYSMRPAMTQMLSAEGTPPGRFMSMSALQFDPGDLPQLQTMWAGQLSDDAIFNVIVATKAKEVLSPNLALAWQVPGVDGYDGGILPLRTYATFTQQFTGAATPSPDGRLREYVLQSPPNWLLNITNTRWLIADKVGDAWVDGVYYDRQFAVSAPDGLEIGHVPQFAADMLGLLYETDAATGTPILQVTVTTADGATILTTVNAGDSAAQWQQASVLTAITLDALSDDLVLQAATLIDSRSGAFMSLAPGPYRLAHSGDVKVYENLAVWPRAFVVDTLNLGPNSVATAATITRYDATRVDVAASGSGQQWLVLSDTMYPGWTATVDDQPADIVLAAGLFRAVSLPAGEHEVVFRFQPRSVRHGAALCLAGLLLWATLWLTPQRRRFLGD